MASCHGQQQENERKQRLARALGLISCERRETQEIILTDLRSGVELDGLQPPMGKTTGKTKRPGLR
jgi:hypothetical protein